MWRWLRDGVLLSAAQSLAKQGGGAGADSVALSQEYRFALLLDGIKLIGTGNGAGSLGSLAAMYYFLSRSELHPPIKLAAITFLIGLIVIGLAVLFYIIGLTGVASFYERHGTDVSKLPLSTLEQAMNYVVLILFSLIAAAISLLFFLI